MSSRRDFLKNSALAMGAFTIIPSAVWAAKPAPSDKINMAFIGVGNRGGGILRQFMKTGMVNMVAMCDTDMGAPHTLPSTKLYPKVPKFQDFRVMFDKMANEIDAVCIGTPDFSHFPMTMLAMSLGKGVYVEKPLSRTFNEAELLMNAAEKYGVATQMGNQGHSGGNYFQFKAFVEAGIIKNVRKVTAHMNNKRRWHGWDTGMTSFPAAQAMPDTLDWDTWLGTAEHHDYHKDLINGQWRCWYDFGMGALGDWGAHIMDSIHEFLDLGLPYEIDPVFIDGHNPLFFPQQSTIDFKFPKRGNMPACDITWYDGLDNIPQVPKGYGTQKIGDDVPDPSTGKIKPAKLNPGKIIYSDELTFKGGTHSGTLDIIPKEAEKDMADKLPKYAKKNSNHFENLVLAVKGEEETRSPFSVAGPLSQVFCLGVIAQRLNTTLKFDRETKQFKGNDLANKLLVGTPPRKGWEEFYKL